MKRFFATLLMAIPVLGLAQSNYQKGYVVTASKDTLRGYINFKERSLNPVQVSFKERLDGNSQLYTLDNCAGYGIDELEHYQRFAVNVSLSQIEVSSLTVGPDLSFKRDTVFLKVLLSGEKLTLFSYRDKLKLRFYMLEAGSEEPVELIRNLYLDLNRPSAVVRDGKYIRQLLVVAKGGGAQNPTVENALLNMDYTEEKMIKAVALINNQEIPKSKYKGSRFFAGMGLNASQAGYSGQHNLANPLTKNKISYMPMLTAGMDVFFKPEIGRFIFRTELSVLMGKYDISLRSSENGQLLQLHSFDRASAVLTPQLIYNIYHTPKFKWFVGFGGGLNFSVNSNNHMERLNTSSMEMQVVENVTLLERFNYSLQLMTGVVLNKKIEISAGYSPKVAISNYVSYNVTMQRFRLGLNYLFGKH